ncbi:MAG: c-type cytochrome [Acidobacteria bacterium]|nr:c-type cytochrome [Acidobacteriota bacterium]
MPTVRTTKTISVASILLFVISTHSVAGEFGWEQQESSPAPPKTAALWKLPADAHKLKNPIEAEDATIVRGKIVYDKFCASCHGATGLGDGLIGKRLNPKATDLTDSKKMSQLTDGELFWMITVGKPPMQRFERLISTDDRWKVVHYMRALSK